jgi:hypothetical protein
MAKEMLWNVYSIPAILSPLGITFTFILSHSQVWIIPLADRGHRFGRRLFFSRKMAVQLTRQNDTIFKSKFQEIRLVLTAYGLALGCRRQAGVRGWTPQLYTCALWTLSWACTGCSLSPTLHPISALGSKGWPASRVIAIDTQHSTLDPDTRHFDKFELPLTSRGRRERNLWL